jgi:arylsulfatase A-like enzyme
MSNLQSEMGKKALGKPNLLLITVDALRADHLGCLGYTKSLSPRIDRLASEGMLFSQAIANGPRSPASFPAILASIYHSSGAEHGLPLGATTLAEILKRHGYATAGFCAGNVYISHYYGYQRGFDEFQDFLTLESGSKAPERKRTGRFAPIKSFTRRILEDSGRYDGAFLLFSSALRGKKNIADMAKAEDVHPFEDGETLSDQAIAWLSRPRDGPFFLWLHYMDVHFPYLPRVARYRPSDYGRFALSLLCLLFKRHAYPRQVLIDLYDHRIRDMDGILGQLLDRLESDGLLQDTVLVLTADHGEEFSEHGGWTHSAKLYDELLRVPLVIKGPGLPQGAVVPEQVGLIDLAPTILEILGIAEQVGSFQGTSFLPWLRGDGDGPLKKFVFSGEVHVGGHWPPFWGQDHRNKTLYRIRSCRSEGWKYIWDEEGSKEELYDLGLDPGETRNLAASEPERRQQFESIVREHFSGLDALEPDAVGVPGRFLTPEEEEEIIQRLRSLGYF